jgi:hypothetical protein
METIDGILREMRKDMPRVIDAIVILRNYADRIEAAHKREQEDAIAATVVAAAKSASEVYEPHIQSEPVGNAAKMREALEKVVEIAKREWNAFRETSAMYEMHEICTAALSAPPRNCDRFFNANDALEAFKKEKGETIIEFIRWIFAEAKGEN